MSTVTTRICDGCQVDSSLKQVHSYQMILSKNGTFLARTTRVDMCNPCAKRNFALVMSTLKMKVLPRHSRGRNAVSLDIPNDADDDLYKDQIRGVTVQ
jgi:hypothetical protein